MYKTRRAVVLRRVDQEVGGRLARTSEFWSNASVVRHKGLVGQIWPISSNAFVKHRRAIGINIEIRIVDPLDVGPKAHAISKIEGNVNTESAIDRCRVNEPREDRFACITEIAAFG